MGGCAGGGWIRHVDGGVSCTEDAMVEITAWDLDMSQVDNVGVVGELFPRS